MWTVESCHQNEREGPCYARVVRDGKWQLIACLNPWSSTAVGIARGYGVSESHFLRRQSPPPFLNNHVSIKEQWSDFQGGPYRTREGGEPWSN